MIVRQLRSILAHMVMRLAIQIDGEEVARTMLQAAASWAKGEPPPRGPFRPVVVPREQFKSAALGDWEPSGERSEFKQWH